jgi:hypothetical protein
MMIYDSSMFIYAYESMKDYPWLFMITYAWWSTIIYDYLWLSMMRQAMIWYLRLWLISRAKSVNLWRLSRTHTHIYNHIYIIWFDDMVDPLMSC